MANILGGLFGREARTVGVHQVDNLLEQALKLKAGGFESKDVARLLPLVGGIGGGAALTAAATASPVSNALTQFGPALASEFVGSRLFGSAGSQPGLLGSAIPQPEAASGEPAGKGFLTTTSEQKAIYEWVTQENYNRQRLNIVLAPLGKALPLLDPDALIAQASAVKEQELGKATERKIQQIQAERGFDVQLAEILRQQEVEKQRIASEAEVAAQREKSLGDVQRQRVESSYATASNLLDQAIKDVVARERYENNTALAELARAI